MSKRGVDIVFSSLGLAVAGPVILILMALIKLDSRGSALFIQPRVGRNERPFKLYKLRTMFVGTAEVQTHLTPPSSITGLGQWLRKTKLDELPQLYNVLKGEMSLVGPRPGLLGDAALTQARRKLDVLSVRPGMTGLAQVCGSDMSQPEALAVIDAHYVRSHTLLLDLQILALTIGVSGGSRSVLLNRFAISAARHDRPTA
jgi:O-antigen biosynthesis protein WbqP